MFDSVLLEVPRAERRRRKLTLLATLAGECFMVAVLVAVPLLYLDALPGVSVRAGVPVTVSYAPPVVPLASAPSAASGNHRSVALIRSTDEAVVRRTVANPQLIYDRWRAESAEVTHDLRLVRDGPCCDRDITALLGTETYVPPPPKLPDKVRISEVKPGMIVRRVEPHYPPRAQAARVHGEVVLQAQIGKDGGIEGLRVVSGHPMLAGAALAAVGQWRFHPYLLNGSPVEVEARITVRFVLGGN